MTREWQPGDVALVRNQWGVWNVAICSLRTGVLGWVWKYGVADDYDRVDDPDRTARPLVVIDPEDAEQVERLLASLMTQWPKVVVGLPVDDRDALNQIYLVAIKQALREFANPKSPKPDEPTGLGAVVRDAGGRRWVRALAPLDSVAPWKRDDCGHWGDWSGIDAVEVLSEGVIA